MIGLEERHLERPVRLVSGTDRVTFVCRACANVLPWEQARDLSEFADLAAHDRHFAREHRRSH